jgi:hypothetical protein
MVYFYLHMTLEEEVDQVHNSAVASRRLRLLSAVVAAAPVPALSPFEAGDAGEEEEVSLSSIA